MSNVFSLKTGAVSVPYPWTNHPCTVPEPEPVEPIIAPRHEGGYALRQLLSVPCLFLHRLTMFHADSGASPLRHYCTTMSN